MPELPEVETVRRGLEQRIIGRQILDIKILNKTSFAGSEPVKLIGARITAARRRGKVLIIDLDSGFSLLIHLKMTGQIIFRKDAIKGKGAVWDEDHTFRPGAMRENVVAPHERSVNWGAGHPTNSFVNDLPDKSTRVVFALSDFPKLSVSDPSVSETSYAGQPAEPSQATNLSVSSGIYVSDSEGEKSSPESSGKSYAKLFFNDQRKFGWIKLVPTAKVEQEDFICKLGPEALADDPKLPAQFLNNVRRHNNTTIKSALLNQTVIAGIGNIYADESLWAAKVHPATRVRDLSDEKLEEILDCARKIMRKAIDYGGSTMGNYIKIDGSRGNYLEKFANVFRRNNQPCPRCNTTIIKTRVAGRGTHLCLKCQKYN